MFNLKNTKTRVAWVILAALFAGGFFWVINPSESSLVPPCLLNRFTGWYCPGCGTGRSLYALFHGKCFTAFALNPLLIISIPFIIWMFFNPPWTRKVWPVWLIFWIFIVYFVLRNIPVKPFNYLAPGGMLEQNVSVETEEKE